MAIARLTSKGQITIPCSIRKKANITSGVELDFRIRSNGTIIVKPITSEISELKGIVKTKKKVSSKEIKKAIKKKASRKKKK